MMNLQQQLDYARQKLAQFFDLAINQAHNETVRTEAEKNLCFWRDEVSRLKQLIAQKNAA